MSAPLVALELPRVVSSSAVFKSGHLLISSKGLGWKSWKKRWFILTRTSLVFFKSDPSALPLRGGEVNLTLGGIDLNNAGSVVVREDKKLLTVLFPDDRDGRAFTLKAETTKDLYEWKTALEHALAQAPSTDLVMGHNGIFRSDSNDTTEGSLCQWRDKSSVSSLVVACPILLALEDIDGGPSFLEKALRFLEKYGLKVEGILRQSADVEEVERRVQEYERGKTEFNPDEDAHVIGDCVKHVLRVLPSSPVPASCCIALLEAYRIDLKEARVNALHLAIQEIFPKPNRRLLQRVLKMMRAISSHASDNRMTSSAVAACMAPLLLRPLVSGECELEDSYDTNGDNSAQLLAAANAANNAQAIITLLLEEYENIFYDNIPADSRTSTSGSEDTSDDKKPDVKVNGHHDAENEVNPESDIDLYDYKEADGSPSNSRTLATVNANLESGPFSDISSAKEPLDPQRRASDSMADACVEVLGDESQRSMGYLLSSIDQQPPHHSVPGPELLPDTSAPKLRNSNPSSKKLTFWRRSARRTYSTESIDFFGEEELAIQRLEMAKNDLGQRIAKERRGNAILQASLERRKQALHERRLALEQDVARLQEQLQAERDLRAALEVSISLSSGQFSSSRCMDSKSRVELEEIALAEADVARLKQQVTELNYQLNQQRQHNYRSLPEASNHYRNSLQKYSRQDFDSTLAVSNHERKQRAEVSGSTTRNSKGQLPGSGTHSRQPSRNQIMESTNLFDSYEVPKSVGIESPGRAAYVSSASRTAAAMEFPRQPSTASSTLLELATRLGFFKEKRSQLMQQLHNLDFNYGPTAPEAFVYNLSSPRRH